MTDDTEQPEQRISEGEFRHYVFSRADVRAETERLLKQAGYTLKATNYMGLVEPDFRAKRTSGASDFRSGGHHSRQPGPGPRGAH